MTTFANKAIRYFVNLTPPREIPNGISIINPYKFEEINGIIHKFYKKYFDDNRDRVFVLGINPGRFGGGITGVSFTDPVALSEYCDIENDLGTKKELSSKFIYKMIKEYGGVKRFYSKNFLSALFPLAITKDGKNYNYYDEKELYKFLKTYIVNAIKKQVELGAVKDFAVCLGKKNAKYFSEINDEYKIFDNIRVLDHPRYIMQYRLRQVDDYLKKYLEVLQ